MRNYKGPVFQHRHYAEIADAIARTTTREELIICLIGKFKMDNGKFDAERFRAAMEGNPKGKDKR